MLPTIQIGSLVLPSFSTMMLIAFIVGAVVAMSQLNYLCLKRSYAWEWLPWAAVSGVLGSKVYAYVTLIVVTHRFPENFWNVGEVWYGGAIAGIGAIAWQFKRARLPLFILFDFGAPVVAFGHAIGRIGCFLVGDDYGIPTNGPFRVLFPHSLPTANAAYMRSIGIEVPRSISDSTLLAVYPTQLFEVAALVLIGIWTFRECRRPHRRWGVAADYAILYGVWRFFIEFIRVKEDHLWFGVTSSQYASVALIAIGVLLRMRSTVVDDGQGIRAATAETRI
ncbi:MAG: prolipoprotein diacylglyceryl transferase family protein [Gemmatimonadaceae bacterium]